MQTANEAAKTRPGHVPALDGVRAIAIALVMMFHARCYVIPGAFAGVDLFFVLSGFLITRLLWKEQVAAGVIDIGAFYIRRITRLVPALMLMLTVYVFVAPLLWPGANHAFQAGLAFFYASDYARAFWGIPQYLTHTWSLAVEEHFYLLWPLLVPVIMRRGATAGARLLLIAYLAAWAWRLLFVSFEQGWDPMYYRFDTRISGLLLGSLVAALLAGGRLQWLVGRTRLVAWFALLFMAATLMSAQWGDAAFWVMWLPILELSAAALVACLVIAPRCLGFLSWAPMTFLGRISYGMYLWHYPIFYFLRETLDWQQTLLVGCALTVPVAWLSLISIERLGFRLREHWLARRRNSALSSPAA